MRTKLCDAGVSRLAFVKLRCRQGESVDSLTITSQ